MGQPSQQDGASAVRRSVVAEDDRGHRAGRHACPPIGRQSRAAPARTAPHPSPPGSPTTVRLLAVAAALTSNRCRLGPGCRPSTGIALPPIAPGPRGGTLVRVGLPQEGRRARRSSGLSRRRRNAPERRYRRTPQRLLHSCRTASRCSSDQSVLSKRRRRVDGWSRDEAPTAEIGRARGNAAGCPRVHRFVSPDGRQGRVIRRGTMAV